MKGFLRSLLIMVLLAASIVGGFYFYSKDAERKQDEQDKQWLAEQEKINDKRTEQASDKAKALQRDRDGDGLTFAEEQRLGTSDFQKDSDLDGIPDKYDIVPTKEGRKVTKYISWRYKTPWNWELALPIDVISYYEKVPRAERTNDKSYYSPFLEANDVGMQKLVDNFDTAIEKAKKQEWDYYDEVMFIVRMTQQLKYNPRRKGIDTMTKYPIQTINDGGGDSEDLSVLTAAILKRLGYDVKLAYINSLDTETTHFGIVVLGEDVEGTSWTDNGKKSFYYIETTDIKKGFGDLPAEWQEGTQIELIDI